MARMTKESWSVWWDSALLARRLKSIGPCRQLPTAARGRSSLKSASLAPEDLENLNAWYRSLCDRLYLHDASAELPGLVVLLEDLESVNAQVLDVVIHTFSFVGR